MLLRIVVATAVVCLFSVVAWGGPFTGGPKSAEAVSSEKAQNPAPESEFFALEPPAQAAAQGSAAVAAQGDSGTGLVPAKDALRARAGGGFTGGAGHSRNGAAVAADTGNPTGSGFSGPGFFTPPPVYNRIIAYATKAQHSLRGQMVSFASDIQSVPYGSAFWLFLGLSFIYGVVHAVGPGHGKAVVFCYFLGRSGSAAKGLLMGNLLTAVHVLSAAVLVFAAHLLFEQGAARGIHGISGSVQRFSYGVIMVAGAVMALHALYELFSGRLGRRVRDAKSGCCSAGYGSIATVSLLAGLVPCPAAVLILTFARGLDITQAGVLALVTLALGMGLTTSAFGVLSMMSRRVLMHTAGCATSSTRVITLLYGVLSVAGALAITLLGFIMFAGTA
ncbi:nickel/cobalt transporter [Oleidesulfovibrio sp.]|uniref:nickel/cobalt transporter n=1 Tax=Oleidesulfovibrio sp. TaxID=2909707 RepID=UPI003A848D3A